MCIKVITHTPVYTLFFFNDTATTEIYTLSLHDALPISPSAAGTLRTGASPASPCGSRSRSEEHTSELQSPKDLVCRLLLEKKKACNAHHEERANRATELGGIATAGQSSL